MPSRTDRATQSKPKSESKLARPSKPELEKAVEETLETIAEVKSIALHPNPSDSASAVGLQYTTDECPGIRRKKSGKGFLYYDVDGDRIRDDQTIRRIDSLAIPPAYKDVWICPLDNGHLQATGRDAKGRKQYRYHPLWRTVRDESKFSRMMTFSQALPSIRDRIESDLALPGLPKEKVLAAILKLMELTRIRVGNEEYAKTNHSYGLTTLQDEHVEVSGSKIHFNFRGKSGVDHEIDVKDARLAKVVSRCQHLPGQELFQYVDEHDRVHDITSTDVNDYLRAITGQDFTAKDFRTWAGTVLAASQLCEIGRFTSQTGAKKNIAEAIKIVSSHLGNRPTTCRKYYVHPAVLEAYLDESLHDVIDRVTQENSAIEQLAESDRHALRVEELVVVALLTPTV